MVRKLLEVHLASVQALLRAPALGGASAGAERPAQPVLEGGPGGASAGAKRPAPPVLEGGPAHKLPRGMGPAAAPSSAAAAASAAAASGAGPPWPAVAALADHHGALSAEPHAGAGDLETLRGRLRAFASERQWDQFHTPRNLALALVGEAGELCECLQWCGDAGAAVGLPGWAEEKRDALADEMADVLLYLVRLADRCGVDLPEAAARKMCKNAAKYRADECRGSAKKYNEYV